MPSEFSATAFLRSCRGTSSGTMDCQVGPISAAPMPPTKVSATRYSTVSVSVRASTSSAPLTSASRIWMPIRKRRRSRMSDSTPAGIASRKIGSVAAVWISATAVGLADSSVTIHELATSRMKLPMLPSTVAAHSTAKMGWRSGAKLPEVGEGVLMASCPGHARRRAGTRPPGPGVRRRCWPRAGAAPGAGPRSGRPARWPGG